MSETDPNRQPGEEAPGGKSGADGNAPIPLEPETPPRPRRPETGRAKIDAPGLMDDFDEDADFETDPEVEGVVKGIPVQEKSPPAAKVPVAKVTVEAEQADGGPISPPGSWRIPGAIGAAVTITAAVFAGVYAPSVIWAHVLITLYWAVLHTATGVGAVVVSALLLGRPIGAFEPAAARMFMAVSLFLVVFSLGLPVTGGKIEEMILGAAAYFGAIVVGFHLAPRDAAVVGGAHFGLALLIGLGSLLTGFISGGGAA